MRKRKVIKKAKVFKKKVARKAQDRGLNCEVCSGLGLERERICVNCNGTGKI